MARAQHERMGATWAHLKSYVSFLMPHWQPIVSPRGNSSPWWRRKNKIRVLAFTCSRHRPVMLRHCIMQMQHQSYPVDHVIYVNSAEEQTEPRTSLNYGPLLEDLCRYSPDRTKILYGSSDTPHQNHLRAIGLAKIDDYDLFLKIDDDDIYLEHYVREVVRDFEKHRWDWSGGPSHGVLNGYRWNPDETLAGLGLAQRDEKMGISDVMPPTLALSRRAMHEVLTIKDNGQIEDILWRRHIARVPGFQMMTREERNFVYNIHGGNLSTSSWLEP